MEKPASRLPAAPCALPTSEARRVYAPLELDPRRRTRLGRRRTRARRWAQLYLQFRWRQAHRVLLGLEDDVLEIRAGYGRHRDGAPVRDPRARRVRFEDIRGGGLGSGLHA